MKDRDFLCWLHARLAGIHGEWELVDYMHKLRCIVAATPGSQVTPNDGRGGNSQADLEKIISGQSVPKSHPLESIIRMTVRLHQLIEAGKCESCEADAIRDDMDTPFRELSESEREAARMMSAAIQDRLTP
jgi:hypothetical protein